MKKNRAVYMNGKLHFEYGELELPRAAPGEVVVRVEYVGICGSDVHFYRTGMIGPRPIVGRQILGHECAGTVAEVGAGVTALSVGDRVALEPGEPCGSCEYCKQGRYNLCPQVKFLSSNPYQGAMRDYMSYPAHLAFKLPDNVSTLEGALVEPLAVGLHAARQGGVQLGDTAVILGAGCIGLTTLLACKAMGASRVIVTDIFEKRLEVARRLGADEVVDGSQVDSTAEVLRLTGGAGGEVVFETAGSRVTAAQTEQVAKRGGTIVMVGNIMGETPFDFHRVSTQEITIKSVFRYRNIYPLAIQGIASGQIDVKSIVSHIFSFDQVPEAFDKAANDKLNVVKAVIRVKEEAEK